MAKYSKEEKEHAIKALRVLLEGGHTYHQAAKAVEEKSDIKLLTLRQMAYRLAVEEGYYTPSGQQHPSHTEHGKMISSCHRRLVSEGYHVLNEQNEIRSFMERNKAKGNPDLVATKEGDIVAVEAVERAKSRSSILNQVERYGMVGRVIMVFPFDTTNIMLWGSQDLAPYTD